MFHVLLSLLPLAIGSAILPTWISLVLLLLRSPRGMTKALSFVGAVTTVRLLQGLGAGHVFGRAEDAVQKLVASPLVPQLLLVAGAILLGVGIHGLLRGGGRAHQPTHWFGLLQRAGPLKCGLAGLVLILTSPRQWVLTASAVGVIHHAELSTVQSAIAFLVFTGGAESLILAPIVWASIDRDQLHTRSTHTSPWLRRHTRRLAGVGSILIGVFFLWKGLAALLGD